MNSRAGAELIGGRWETTPNLPAYRNSADRQDYESTI